MISFEGKHARGHEAEPTHHDADEVRKFLSGVEAVDLEVEVVEVGVPHAEALATFQHDLSELDDMSGVVVTEIHDPQALAEFQTGQPEQLSPILIEAQKYLARAMDLKDEIEKKTIELQDTTDEAEKLDLERKLDELVGEHAIVLEAADQLINKGVMGGGEDRKAA